jgi:hypothetical protein
MKDNLYKYHILKDKNLIIEIMRGSFELEEYMKLKKSQFEDPDYDPNFNIIMDIRNIEDIVSEQIIKEYTKIIKPVQLFTRRIKAAVITETPSQVTGAILYKMLEEKSIDYEIFSTFEYALKWLGISKSDLKDLDIIIK